MPSNHLNLSPPSAPAFSLSQHQGLFKWVSSSHQVATVLGFHLQHIQELISFRMDWLYLLADQGTLKSLLQHHSSKASVFLRSAFFTVQLSHPYVTTGKTIALTTQTFVGKIMSLLFNMLSSILKVGYNFSSKEQASFNFLAAVTICSDFGAQKNQVWHCFHCFPKNIHITICNTESQWEFDV